jgi:hypothetical protein
MARRLLVWCLGIGLVAAATGVGAQSAEDRAAARELMAKRGNAVVSIVGSAKVRMSIGGRGAAPRDERVQGMATVLDATGLAVTALSVVDPGEMMGGLLGTVAAAGLPAGMKPEISVDDLELRMRFADGSEVPARVVLRDRDLDLAFVRPIDAVKTPAAALDAPSAVPAAADLVIGLERLGEPSSWALAMMFGTVQAVIDKPRMYYMVTVASSPALGGPVFDARGRFVGIRAMRNRGPAGGGSVSLTGALGAGAEALGLTPIVVPADDIRAVAKQVKP